MEKTTLRFSGGALALAAALASAPGTASADPRLQARLYDTGDLTSQCSFSEDGRSARCIGVEGTALNVGYACPEGWYLFHGRTDIETVAVAAGDTVRASSLDIQRIIAALVSATEETRDLACVAPSAAAAVSNGRTVSGDVPQIAPLSLTVVPGRPNLRAGDGQVVEVDRPVTDEVAYPVTVSAGAGGAKVIGQGNKLAPVGLVEVDVRARQRRALAPAPSALQLGLGATVITGTDVTETVQRVDAQGRDVGEPSDVRHNLGYLVAGPTLQACTPDGIGCVNVGFQAGANFMEGDFVALGKASLDVGVSVAVGTSGFRASVGKMREGVRVFLRLMGFVAKDGDEEVLGGGIEVGVTF